MRDYEPALLDELTSTGEVIWAGHGALPGQDGWVSLHLADQAPLTLPEPASFEHSPGSWGELHQAVLDALEPGGAWFFRQLGQAVRSPSTTPLAAALWDLVWAGRVGNDTLAPLRSLIGGRGTHRSAGPGRACCAAAHPTPRVAGRCCPRSTPTRPGAPTPPRSGSSTGTAS